MPKIKIYHNPELTQDELMQSMKDYYKGKYEVYYSKITNRFFVVLGYALGSTTHNILWSPLFLSPADNGPAWDSVNAHGLLYQAIEQLAT